MMAAFGGDYTSSPYSLCTAGECSYDHNLAYSSTPEDIIPSEQTRAPKHVLDSRHSLEKINKKKRSMFGFKRNGGKK